MFLKNNWKPKSTAVGVKTNKQIKKTTLNNPLFWLWIFRNLYFEGKKKNNRILVFNLCKEQGIWTSSQNPVVLSLEQQFQLRNTPNSY